MKKGFTLIELLVVIAIIALLVSILMPSLKTARELAQKVVCANNIRNIGMAETFYSQDNDDSITCQYGSRMWYDFLIFSKPFDPINSAKYVYLENTHLLVCPTRLPNKFNFDNTTTFTDANWWQNYTLRFFTYGMHGYFSGGEATENASGTFLRLAQLSSPADVSLLADTSTSGTGKQFYLYADYSLLFGQYGVGLGHVGQANVYFADGHISGHGKDTLEDNGITAFIDENNQPVQ